MKTALICIAKNEDHYIDEWLKYHIKLGFTDIFVYQNNWRYSGIKTQYDNVHWIEFDGDCMQMKAYNNFIDNNYSNYDWGAFFDVDEYLCLKKYDSLVDFLNNYNRYCGIGVNWRCFGDNNLKEVIDNNYSCINRFTKCEKQLDKHIKTILNFNICKNKIHFINPHFVDLSILYNIIIDISKKQYVKGPWNFNAIDDSVQLNHYNSKTIEEYKQKLTRGKADTPKYHPMYYYKISDFYKHNKNDIEDFTAYNFLNKNDFKEVLNEK